MANELGKKRINGQATAQVEELYMLRHATDNEDANILDTLKNPNKDWYPSLSLKGTVSVGQDAPSYEMIQVDQFDAPIGVTTEPGDFNFEFFMPSFETKDVAAWLGSDAESITDDEIDGLALKLSGQMYTVTILIKSKIGPLPYMLFTRVQVSVTFSQEDKVFGFRIAGRVLAPTSDKNAPVYLFKALPGIRPAGVTPSTGA